MKNTHNMKLELAASKRRAKLLQQKISGKKTDNELAAQHKVSRQRIQWMLAKAKKEANEQK